MTVLDAVWRIVLFLVVAPTIACLILLGTEAAASWLEHLIRPRNR